MLPLKILAPLMIRNDPKQTEFIDLLHAPFIGLRKKPRSYRQKARKQHLAVAKQKKPGAKKIRLTLHNVRGYLYCRLFPLSAFFLPC